EKEKEKEQPRAGPAARHCGCSGKRVSANEARKNRRGPAAKSPSFVSRTLCAFPRDRRDLNRRRRFGGLPACDREDPPPVRRRNPPIRFRDVEARALGRAHRLIA